jgi:hypothetical protein
VPPVKCGDFQRVISCFVVVITVLGSAGCFAPALGLAPLALKAGEAAVGALGSATHAANVKSGDEGSNASEAEERCDVLEFEVPSAMELRIADTTPTAWRQLQLGGTTDAPQWQIVIDDHSDAAGWHPFQDLYAMRFVPALQRALKAGESNYLAYAPVEPRTSIERDQLVSLTVDFGPGLGTFQWNGRAYQYTVVNRLPCFPGPLVAARRSRN